MMTRLVKLEVSRLEQCNTAKDIYTLQGWIAFWILLLSSSLDQMTISLQVMADQSKPRKHFGLVL